MNHWETLTRLLVYTQANLDRDLGLESLGRKVNLSPAHLQRVFKAAIGETPKGYVTRLRVERAAFCLLAHDSTVAEIAANCGFRNPETFIRAFQRLKDFRSESSFGTWIHTIAMSVSLNGLRKVKRFRTRESSLDDALTVGTATRHAEPDLKERLRQAIDGLPEGYRTVFVMHDLEGYSHGEIAASLGVAEGTSKARLFRARSKLREVLGAAMEEYA